MKSFLNRVSRNKKKILYMLFFFFLAVSLPITGYFVSSDRSFDDRGEAWWDLDFDKDRSDRIDIDFDSDDPGDSDSDPTPLPSDEVDTNAVSITSFNISPSRVQEGGKVTVSWNSVNASSCTLTTDLGTRAAPTSASRSVDVTRGVGTHSYKLVCRNASSQDSKTASFTVVSSGDSDDPTGSVSITSFSINPSTVEEGGRITVSWNSVNASSCTLTTDLGTRDAPTSASRAIDVTRGVGTHSYKLVCRNASSQDSSTATFTVVSSGDSDDLDDEKDDGKDDGGECFVDAHCNADIPYEVCFTPTGICLRGDINNDGDISMGDFHTFREDFISYKQDGWNNSLRRSDLNEDERISMADYSVFVSSYRIIRGLD